MGFSKIIRSILIVLVLGKDVSSLTLQTEDVVVNLQENNSIVLNCTYHKDANEYIPEGNIRWQKQIEGTFKDIAGFSHAGGHLEPFISKDMQSLYKHRTDLIAPNTTLAAVMIIKDPDCHDKGIYRCHIKYLLENEDIIQTSGAFVEFIAKAQKPDEFLVFPNDLEESQSISLMCSADVGGPRGNILIWKIPQNSDTPKLVYTSNSTNDTTENCTGNINVTTTYTVTKEDNGSLFRCSSQNNLTQGQGPSKESPRIIVIYGPSNTRIDASFSNSRAIIGDHVNMECISEGNPSPNYTWKLNFTDVVRNAKYTFSANKSRLSFTITNTTDSGYYQCVASIYYKGKWFNSSSSVNLTVREKSNEGDLSFIEQPCSENPCIFFESCIIQNGSENCSINIWSVVAFLFIALTLIFLTINISLILSRTKQHKRDKGFQIGDVRVSYTREKFEDFGGYADPKDVKRPENGQIKSDKDVRDNPYADPVDFQTQYAVVQKNWETPANSSNLLTNTDSSNTTNPLSSPETTNPKNSTNDEKTPGSTETSETISKPPNVYDDAWV